MALAPIFEGTIEELVRRSHEFAGARVQVFAPATEATDEAETRRPEEVKTPERLVALLLGGLASPAREMQAADWDELKRRAAARANGTTE